MRQANGLDETSNVGVMDGTVGVEITNTKVGVEVGVSVGVLVTVAEGVSVVGRYWSALQPRPQSGQWWYSARRDQRLEELRAEW